MRLGVGSDHAGFKVKEYIRERLSQAGYEVVDYGTHGPESTDYPIYAFRVAEAVARGEVDAGILVCGTGIGMCIAANKVRGVRGAVAWSVETGRLAKRHNNANVLCLPGRLLEPEEAWRVAEAWLGEEFEGGRHARRLALIARHEEDAFC